MKATVLNFQTKHNEPTNTVEPDKKPVRDNQQILIEMLSKEVPFKAVVLAKRFNKNKGFDVVPQYMIRQWKKETLQLDITIKKLNQLQKDYERMIAQ